MHQAWIVVPFALMTLIVGSATLFLVSLWFWINTYCMLRQVKAQRADVRRQVRISDRVNSLAELTEMHRQALMGIATNLDHVLGHVCNHSRESGQPVMIALKKPNGPPS